MPPISVQNFSAAEIDHEMTRMILLAEADDNPIVASILARNAVVPTGTPEFYWKTDSLPARRTQIDNGGAAYDAATTVLGVDNAAIFRVGSIINCEATGELIRVSAVDTADNEITVVRGVGATAAHANSVANNAWLLECGAAFGEGSTSPAPNPGALVEVKNVCQIFKRAAQVTGTAQATAVKSEDRHAYERKKEFSVFRRDMEMSVLHGQYENSDDVVDAEGNRVRVTGGLLPNITGNVWNVGGAITVDSVEENFFGPLFHHSGGPRMVVAGGVAFNALHKLYRGSLRITQGQTAVGLRITEIVTQHGTALLVPHKGLVGTTYAGHLVGVDIDEVKMRHLPGREPKLETDIGENDRDAQKDQWIGEIGWDWGNQIRHAVAKGITGAS